MTDTPVRENRALSLNWRRVKESNLRLQVWNLHHYPYVNPALNIKSTYRGGMGLHHHLLVREHMVSNGTDTQEPPLSPHHRQAGIVHRQHAPVRALENRTCRRESNPKNQEISASTVCPPPRRGSACLFGRGTRNRTLVDWVKASYSTIELHPH